MKLLLDECIDGRLARELSGHEVKTVPQMGWAGVKNGRLLALAEAEFNVFVTVDRNLSFQQNLPQFKLAVMVLHAKTNKLSDLKPLAPSILAALPQVKNGEVTHVGNWSCRVVFS
jgi:predicted nuclease of predicted toxin-antitoxin system